MHPPPVKPPHGMVQLNFGNAVSINMCVLAPFSSFMYEFHAYLRHLSTAFFNLLHYSGILITTTKAPLLPSRRSATMPYPWTRSSWVPHHARYMVTARWNWVGNHHHHLAWFCDLLWISQSLTYFMKLCFLDPREVETQDKIILAAVDDGTLRGIDLRNKVEVIRGWECFCVVEWIMIYILFSSFCEPNIQTKRHSQHPKRGLHHLHVLMHHSGT